MSDAATMPRADSTVRCPDEVDHRNAELGRFLHHLSHELRTPLTAAREYLSMTLDGLAGPLTVGQGEFLTTARTSCDQVTRLLDGLIDVVLIENRELRLKPVLVDVAAFLTTSAGALEPLAARKRINISIHSASDLGSMNVDLDRFAQIVRILVSNAVKFSGADSEIILAARRQADALEFSVHDSGVGIEPAAAERIFDKHFQVLPEGVAAHEAGLGLGLHIGRELVRLHGGDIRVSSRLGVGSTFSFTIPATQKASTET